jgi:hypothetical protein
MSAAHAYIDDWTEEANPEPPRPRLYLAYSRRDNETRVTDPLGKTQKGSIAIVFPMLTANSFACRIA